MVISALARFGQEEHGAEALHLGSQINTRRIQLRLQFIQLRSFHRLPHLGSFVELLEGLEDLLAVIHKIQDEGVLFRWVNAVEP